VALVLTRVITYAPIVTHQIVVSLTDDSRGVIHDHKMCIVEATGLLVFTF